MSADDLVLNRFEAARVVEVLDDIGELGAAVAAVANILSAIQTAAELGYKPDLHPVAEAFDSGFTRAGLIMALRSMGREISINQERLRDCLMKMSGSLLS